MKLKPIDMYPWSIRPGETDMETIISDGVTEFRTDEDPGQLLIALAHYLKASLNADGVPKRA